MRNNLFQNPIFGAGCILAGVVLIAGAACSAGEAESPTASVSTVTSTVPAAAAITPTTSAFAETSTATSVASADTTPGEYGSEFSDSAMKMVAEGEGISASPEFLNDYAQIVCESLADDVDPMDIAIIAYSNFPQYELMEHATMIGASVGAYCEEFSYIIDSMG